MGVAGLGRAFSLMLPTLAGDPRVELVAGADPRPEARERFSRDFDAPAYADVELMCADPMVDAVYISTPHQFHCANVESAARYGKHALVEKPMALALADCEAMIEAATRARIHLIVGHSHSFDLPIAKTRAIIESETFGALRMINALQFTDFLYRPRRPEELSTEHGGGVIFNQAPHQVDNVRLIGGGRVRSLRAHTGRWDARRPTEGAYSALLEFENGIFATLTYSGYAHFDSDEFVGWIAESGVPKDPAAYGDARAALRGLDSDNELSIKHARNYGGHAYRPPGAGIAEPRWHQHFGMLIASCDRADLRPQPHGVMIYSDEIRRFDPFDPPVVPRAEVIDELWAAVYDHQAPLHSGEWAMATMEVCLAILQSSRSQRDVKLHYQIGLPEPSMRAKA